ncbi:MAG: threonine/serine dehydratase [Candidatus Thorarchaeota archaeon]
MSGVFKGLLLWEILETHKKIQPYIEQTPLIRSYVLEDLIGKEIYLKYEFLQPTKSFKVRGACAKVLALDEEERNRGLITASGGNHGLGVCYAGKQFDTPVTVYVPMTTSQEKIGKIVKWGGKPVQFGQAWDDADEKAQRVAEEEGLVYIHPFDDLNVVKGQGTIGLEMMEQKSDLDAIVASVGGGGLLSGIGMVARQMRPEIMIYGVETEGADAVTQSFRKNRLITLPEITSIATTLAAKRTTASTFARLKAVVNAMETVTDQEALNALSLLMREEKIIVEPATSCTIAALLNRKFALKGVEKIGIVLCGANVSVRELEEWGLLHEGTNQ